jgi:hypothetical protein
VKGRWRSGERALDIVWMVRCPVPTIRQRFEFDTLERGPAPHKERAIGGTTTRVGADDCFVTHRAASARVFPIDLRVMAMDEGSLQRGDSLLGEKVTDFNPPVRCRRPFLTYR